MSHASQRSPEFSAAPSQTQHQSVHRLIIRAILSLASAGLFIRMMGMLSQIVITAHFGEGAAMDAYIIASLFPLLVAQLVAGAIEGSVIPVYTRIRSQGTRDEASALFSTLLNLCLIMAVLLTFVLILLRQQVTFLTAPALDPLRMRLVIDLALYTYPALLLTVLIGFLEAILNAEGQFGWPAYAGALVPLSVAVLVLAMGKTYGVVMLAIGTLIGLSLQLGVDFLRLHRARIVYRPLLQLRNPAVGPILAAAWPLLLGTFIVQANSLIDQIFASPLSAGSISALSYALKLVGVPVGIIFVAVARAALPHLSQQAIHDMRTFKQTLHLYLWAVGIVTAVLAIVMFVLADLIVRILFQRGAFTAADADRTAGVLRGFLIGLVPMAWGFLIPSAISALRKTRVLMYMALFSVVANVVFDYLLGRMWQSFGIALASSVVYTCDVVIQLLVLHFIIGHFNPLRIPPQIEEVIQRIRGRRYYPVRIARYRK